DQRGRLRPGLAVRDALRDGRNARRGGVLRAPRSRVGGDAADAEGPDQRGGRLTVVPRAGGCYHQRQNARRVGAPMKPSAVLLIDLENFYCSREDYCRNGPLPVYDRARFGYDLDKLLGFARAMVEQRPFTVR